MSELSAWVVLLKYVFIQNSQDTFTLCVCSGAAADKRVCDGSEDMQTLQSPYTDTSQLRITNMVHKAVYAIAHAIHNVVCQETNFTTQCDKHTRLESKQVRRNEK